MLRKYFSKSPAEIAVTAWLAAGSLAAVPPAGAVEPHVIPVAVQVRFKVELLTRTWTAEERQQIGQELSDGLTRDLEEVFPFWSFEPSPRQQGVRLVFLLKEEFREGRLTAVLLGDDRALLGEHLLGLIYKPNQEEALDRLAERPQRFRDLVREKILDHKVHQDGIRGLLMAVPVTTEGQWRSASQGSPAVVLALPWEPNFKKLAVSTFRLLGKGSDSRWKEFEASGSLDPGRYPVESSRAVRPFQALQVIPPPESSSQELIRYTPQEIFLKEYVHSWIVARMKKGPVPGAPP